MSNKRKVFTKEERQQIYNKCNGKCAYCGCDITFKQMQIDHVIAWSLVNDENTDAMINLLPACRSCNHYKSTLTIEKFRKQLSEIPGRLQRANVTYRIGCRYGLIEPKPQEVVFYYEKIGIEVNK